MFTIESGVEMPETRGRPMTYPFAEMQVGDSFAVPVEKLVAVRSALSKWRQANGGGKEFSVRKHEGAYRCWRVR